MKIRLQTQATAELDVCSNPLDLDLCINRTFRFGEEYECRILSLLNLKNGVRAHAVAQADQR